MASNDSSVEQEERLKSALWYSIGKYIDEECLTSDVNATPQFIGALTELVYTQIGTHLLFPTSIVPMRHTLLYPPATCSNSLTLAHSKHFPRPRDLLRTRRPERNQH